jgi:hypothetical protein
LCSNNSIGSFDCSWANQWQKNGINLSQSGQAGKDGAEKYYLSKTGGGFSSGPVLDKHLPSPCCSLATALLSQWICFLSSFFPSLFLSDPNVFLLFILIHQISFTPDPGLDMGGS